MRFKDSYGMVKGGYVLLGAIATVAALMAVIAVVIVTASRWQGPIICRHWSEQTRIPTKFRILSFADTGTCLARTPDGRWILNSRWTTFVQGQK